MIYILENVENFYKIGYSKNPQERVKQLSTGNSSELRLLKTFETKYDSKIEAYLKRYFNSKKIKGEWFDLSKEDIKKIDSLIENKESQFDMLLEYSNPYFSS